MHDFSKSQIVICNNLCVLCLIYLNLLGSRNIIQHIYSPILEEIRQRSKDSCVIFQNSKSDLLPRFQDELLDCHTLKTFRDVVVVYPIFLV